MPTPQRFWDSFIVNTTTGCWEWGRHRNAAGYGATSTAQLFPGRTAPVLAHRAAWRLVHGAIPAGLCVCHTCDNPPCGNPDHLFLGTHSENIRDAVSKGRIPGRRKLQPVDALALRAALLTDEPTADLAQRFKLSKTAVSQLVRGESWKHLGGALLRPERAARRNKIKKLSADDVAEIRRRVASGEVQRVVAAAYGVTQGTVSQIVHRVSRELDGGPPAVETNNWRTLTAQQVATIRMRLAAGETHAGVAQDYGCTREAVTKIAQGRSYAHLTGGAPIRRHRLTPSQREELLRRLAAGETQTRLALEFGVSQSLVSNLKRGAGG